VQSKRLLPPVYQDDVLRRIAELSREPKILRAALHRLRSGGVENLVNVIARGGSEELSDKRRKHIEDHWLQEGAEVMLRGAIEASEAALMTGKPIQAYWVFGHAKTSVAICQSPEQITLLVMRPYPGAMPTEGEMRTQFGVTIVK
jgi:hypothetical protein